MAVLHKIDHLPGQGSFTTVMGSVMADADDPHSDLLTVLQDDVLGITHTEELAVTGTTAQVLDPAPAHAVQIVTAVNLFLNGYPHGM